MRIALMNEDGYPYRSGAAAIWCQRLVRGLAEHVFHVVSVVDGVPEPVLPVPGNVPSLTTVSIAGRAVAPVRGPAVYQRGRVATHAAVLLCRGMLEESPHGLAMFRSGLRLLAGLAADGTHPLAGIPLAQVLLDAWRAASGPGRVAGAEPLPWPEAVEARYAAALLEIALRPLTVQVPGVDCGHLVNGGLSVLLALAARWRHGTPYLLTEHASYPDHPLLARAGAGPSRTVLLRFLRALTRLGYTEAAAVAPPSERMSLWACRHGADRARITVVPPGVDPRDHPPLTEEPPEPVIIWVGPATEVPTAMRAFTLVRRDAPDARLVIVGPDRPAGTLPDGVGFTGPVTGYRALYARGTVITLSGRHDTMPYPLIEAMLCARPVVWLDASGPAGATGLAEALGTDALVATPDDPARLAGAWLALLGDADLRRRIGARGRQVARARFSLAAMRAAYQQAYQRITAGAAGSAGRSSWTGS